TGFEPAVFGLTGRHVNHYTTPPNYAAQYTTTFHVRQIWFQLLPQEGNQYLPGAPVGVPGTFVVFL
ncbi:MAG: hypothetical protein JXM73_14905, partial [Anaerolineae bacterium]|nr:hypothetical protein [Anaerolineae bacterium]